MKKLLMTVAVLGCAAAVTAQTVTSANIVGYNKVSCDPGLTIVAVSFTGGQSVDEMFGPMTSGGDASSSDTVTFWDNATGIYRTYWYCDGVHVSLDGHWLDGSWAFATEVVPAGTAFWVNNKTGSAQDMMVAGEVSLAGTNSVPLGAGLSMVNNPYPTGLTLGMKGTDPLVDSTYSQLAESAFSGGDASSSDTISFWNGSAYVTYWYCDGVHASLDGRWLDGSWADMSALPLPLGEGVWYNRKSTATTWDKTKNFTE